MKKFKHKQTGYIAELLMIKSIVNKDFYSIKHKEGFTHIPKEFIENSNDWEEIKEEKQEETPWLITAFKEKNDGTEALLGKNGRYYINKDMMGLHSLHDMLYKSPCVKDGSFIIYSVKNNKGQEFTIGSKLTVADETLTIKEFVIFRDKYMYVLFNETDEHENINDLEKVKSADKPKLLFTTYDKVELFEEKQLFSVCIKANWEERRYSIKQAKQITDAWLHFNTKEAREEYIKQHKPKFSMADIEKVLNGLIITHKPINKESVLSSLNNLKK